MNLLELDHLEAAEKNPEAPAELAHQHAAVGGAPRHQPRKQ